MRPPAARAGGGRALQAPVQITEMGENVHD